MTGRKKFITSALPYVNNQPHLGNIVGSVLGADVYSRYCKKKGDDAIFICGTDEYGTATEMEAVKQNKHPKQIVEENRVLHKKVYEWFGCQFDFFGETSSPKHTELVQEIFKKCYENGYFEKQDIQQFYCEKCAQFLADRYVEGTCKLCEYDSARGDQCDQCGKCLKTDELQNPRCVICLEAPVLKTSPHLFLRLDLLQSKIKEVMDKKKNRWTTNAINIYNEWLDKELISRCMTRKLKYMWGVPVPLQGFEDKVFYVWFDAVIGYLTFLSEAVKEWKEWLNGAEIVQFMGKDNVFFHAFIFPGILLAADPNSPTVDIINSTEYLTFNKEKFSKSRKIGIFGMDLVEKDLGCSSYWRFYLVKRRPETKDADFNVEDFVNSVNSDLRSNFGNLCQRVLKFIQKNCNGKVDIDSIDDDDSKLVTEINNIYMQYVQMMDAINLRDGLAKAIEVSSLANKYIQDLQKNKEKLPRGFQIGYSAIVLIAHMLEPFTPEISETVFTMCNICKNEKFPTFFEIIRKAEISSDVRIVAAPFTENQLKNLYSYSYPSKSTELPTSDLKKLAI